LAFCFALEGLECRSGFDGELISCLMKASGLLVGFEAMGCFYLFREDAFEVLTYLNSGLGKDEIGQG
jgi:hypothetical protein